MLIDPKGLIRREFSKSFPSFRDKPHSKNLVTLDNCPHRSFKHPGIDRPTKTDIERDMVDRARGMNLLIEPQSPLGGTERPSAFPRGSVKRRDDRKMDPTTVVLSTDGMLRTIPVGAEFSNATRECG